MQQKNKKRIDLLIQEQRPDLSRSLIQAWIKQGLVSVAGSVVSKPAMLVDEDVVITLQRQKPQYVSRSGAKLEQALQEFQIDVTGLVALDVGLSTGGFTDCLLQHGIAQVFGVDVGTGQVHPTIAANEKVVVMEQTDIRDCVGKVPPVDIIVVDVSFISVTKFTAILAKLLKPAGALIILIKPQFEGEPADLARGGIVKNDATRNRIVQHVLDTLQHHGFVLQNSIECTTVGGDGNIEYLAYCTKGSV